MKPAEDDESSSFLSLKNYATGLYLAGVDNKITLSTEIYLWDKSEGIGGAVQGSVFFRCVQVEVVLSFHPH